MRKKKKKKKRKSAKSYMTLKNTEHRKLFKNH